MVNATHLELLQQGFAVWNAWRAQEPSVIPDLSDANLRGANLTGANLAGAKLRGADLNGAALIGAKLMGADLGKAQLIAAFLGRARLEKADLRQASLWGARLPGAKLMGANLRRAILLKANFVGANLSEANLSEANLTGADLSGADLSDANLQGATLIETNIANANLTGCHVYGISAWRLKLSEHTKQQNLVITAADEAAITVDDIEVAQFVYLLLHNEKIRRVIDTITSKVVLILGRFTPERKAVLDKLRDELRKSERGYAPVVFDFEKAQSQTTLETVTLLARMARFVIADLSDAKSILQELQAIVPSSPKLPVQPIIIAAQEEPGMFDFFKSYPWVLKTYPYADLAQLTADLDEKVIQCAEEKVLELRGSLTA